MRKVYSVTCLILALCFSCLGQNTEANKVRATEVFDKARKAAGEKVKSSDIKSLLFEWEITKRTSINVPGHSNETDKKIKSKWYFVLPDLKQAKEERITEKTTVVGGRSLTPVTTIEETIINGDGFSYTRDSYRRGKKLRPFVLSGNKEKSRENTLPDVFSRLFPITFNLPYVYSEPYYAGIAESKDRRASILESVVSNKSDDTKTTCRLFFDVKTNLLLLITYTTKKKGSLKSESKHYYSDYREIAGRLVPTEIKTESSVYRKGDLIVRIIENAVMEDLKINPAFKSGFFKTS